ncbi:hypothetical protein Nepgr_016787 [Nepenthes gracilis]|uniref:WRKY domain-containing protein n=1 Tax=Nepenthes gracilis TaxID=150966 RepID=A0AAD3SRA5_NEPGR|nr:hypothetical protein Nepgr_016787 [Nepenthes gracilis]
MLNQGLTENQGMPSEMGFYSNPTNLTFLPPLLNLQQFLKPFSMPPSLSTDPSSNHTEALISSSSSSTPNLRQDVPASHNMGASQLLSLQRSRPSLCFREWGEGGTTSDQLIEGKRSNGDHHINLGVSALKMKKMKARRKVREPRFCFKTMSDVDVLDDGYKWRKYGQKVVKNTQHPRSYYRCTQDNCRVKKRVERLAEDPRMVITTYEGRHAHSPSHDMDESHGNNFCWLPI